MRAVLFHLSLWVPQSSLLMPISCGKSEKKIDVRVHIFIVFLLPCFWWFSSTCQTPIASPDLHFLSLGWRQGMEVGNWWLEASCGFSGTWGSCAWENCRPPWTKAPRNWWAGLGDHRLTAGEVSTLLYLPVAHESLMVNESGEVKEEWETLQPLPPHGAQRKKILSLWLENQTRVKRLCSSPRKKQIVIRAVSQLAAVLYLLGPPKTGLRWKNVTPRCSSLFRADRETCKFFCLKGFRGLSSVRAEQRLNISLSYSVACGSRGER